MQRGHKSSEAAKCLIFKPISLRRRTMDDHVHAPKQTNIRYWPHRQPVLYEYNTSKARAFTHWHFAPPLAKNGNQKSTNKQQILEELSRWWSR